MSRSLLAPMSLTAVLALSACSHVESASPAASASFAADGLTESETAYLTHRAQAVLYRWFYFYETAEPNFEDQFAILDDDVNISGTVAVTSLAGYKESIENPSFVFGQNAHHVERIQFVKVTSAGTELAVQILYQGVDKDGQTNAFRLSYKIEMVEVGAALPKIKSMVIAPIEASLPVFVPTYADNLANARVHEAQAKDLELQRRDL